MNSREIESMNHRMCRSQQRRPRPEKLRDIVTIVFDLADIDDDKLEKIDTMREINIQQESARRTRTL